MKTVLDVFTEPCGIEVWQVFECRHFRVQVGVPINTVAALPVTVLPLKSALCTKKTHRKTFKL